jgi:uncharacterized membrane protein YeaQ/YmgE (transglycosylase-associated protein family)
MDDIIVLIVIGALAGSAAASILGRRKPSTTSNWLRNTAIGVLGALIGPVLFNALDISLPEFLEGTMTAADMLVALVGALIVIVVADLIRK